MIEWLQIKFPPGYNYFVAQQDAEQINQYLSKQLFIPTHAGTKYGIWGESARKLSAMGNKIGWVPNKLVAAFLAETAELEIADAYVARNGILHSSKHHLESARELLNQLDLFHIAQRNPYHLSEGETKLLWFLTQWAKQPEYLILGHLPSSLSKQRTADILDFILSSLNNSKTKMTIIFGYVKREPDWFSEFLKIANEKFPGNFLVYERVIFK